MHWPRRASYARHDDDHHGHDDVHARDVVPPVAVDGLLGATVNITEAQAVSRVFRAIEAGDVHVASDDLEFLAMRAGAALKTRIMPPAKADEVLL